MDDETKSTIEEANKFLAEMERLHDEQYPKITEELWTKFLIEVPLYTKVKTQMAEAWGNVPWATPSLFCENCQKIRTFNEQRPPEAQYTASIVHGQYVWRLVCGVETCHDVGRSIWFEVNKEQNYIRKFGQLPPWEAEIPQQLYKELGKDDGDIFRKAHICLSQGYGIGACIYLRRVLENQLNKLLTIQMNVEKASEADESVINELQNALNEPRAENRIRLVSRIAPRSLSVGETNPIALVYDQLSVGIHQLSDDDCIAIGQQASGILTHMLVELKREEEQKQQYLKQVRRLLDSRVRKDVTSQSKQSSNDEKDTK